MTVNYQKFLEQKVQVVKYEGFEIDESDLTPDVLFDHTKDAVRWALKLGKALIAMSFGLAKTRTQIEIAKQVHTHTGKSFLIVCPLGVKHQFQHEDGPLLGTRWEYVRTDDEITAATSPYLITNYERVRDGNIHPSLHPIVGVSLDEGSVIRSLGSKTYQVFIDAFADLPFRFVATATPSPNDYKELIYYAEFLGIMDHGQALTRWFKRDTEHAGHLTLHPHHEKDFWLWIASWALFLFTPSDLGYSDDGYILPSLDVFWHRVKADQTRAWAQKDKYGQHRLLLDAAAGVSEASQEKKETLAARIEELKKIMQDRPGEHWLLWHTLEREREAIEKAVPESLSVYGSQELELREERILAFVHGEIPILATKPEIAGSGCNFQRHCHLNIFLGVDYKFQDFIQAVHRTYRFQQTEPVEVHIIYAESEDAVIDVLKRKWDQHNILINKMRDIIRQYGMSHEAMNRDLKRSLGVIRSEVKGNLYTIVNNDCVLECRNLPDNHFGLIHTSIPFGNHYSYTTSAEDFGHNPSDADFWVQMDYLIPDLLRILKPGRVAAIHVKDRILYGHQTESGFMEVSEFSDDCVKAFKKHGFLYEGRRTIVTDVVRENASTYRLGYTEMTRDASKMGSGLPEYLLCFRKPPTSADTSRADEPVTKDKVDFTRARWQYDAHSFWRSNGNSPLTPEELYNYAEQVSKAEELDRKDRLSSSFFMDPPKSPTDWVWDDVVSMRTLNSQQSRSREQNHICPLPFDIVERAIKLYSNPGDLVLDPFNGIGTVPYIALKLGRKAYGIELKPEYYQCAIKYLDAMEREVSAPTLFDYLQITSEQDA